MARSNLEPSCSYAGFVLFCSLRCGGPDAGAASLQLEDLLAYQRSKQREAELAAIIDRLGAAQGHVGLLPGPLAACLGLRPALTLSAQLSTQRLCCRLPRPATCRCKNLLAASPYVHAGGQQGGDRG